MKLRTILFVFAMVIVFAIGFWLYGIGRTMRETVAFNTTAFLSGLFLGVGLPLLVILPLLVAKIIYSHGKVLTVPFSLLVVKFTVLLLVGSIASEVWILRDEASFSAETTKGNVVASYSRPRAWPNQTCSLVFVPGKGIHSTD